MIFWHRQLLRLPNEIGDLFNGDINIIQIVRLVRDERRVCAYARGLSPHPIPKCISAFLSCFIRTIFQCVSLCVMPRDEIETGLEFNKEYIYIHN